MSDPHKIPYYGEIKPKEAMLVIRTWTQSDTYPWMKRKAIDYFAPRAAFICSIIVLTIHYWWAFESKCGVNFQRSGAVIALVSAALYSLIEWHKSDAGVLGGTIKRFRFFSPYFMLPLLLAMGTVIWGYGDLLPMFGNCTSNSAPPRQ
jgi:hypothetical protein